MRRSPSGVNIFPEFRNDMTLQNKAIVNLKFTIQPERDMNGADFDPSPWIRELESRLSKIKS
jgi:hypothetical protein